jgi:hypothetical protein
MVTEQQILQGFYNSSAPQDWESEIKPVEKELQFLDRNLRIIWNPRAFLARPGKYDVSGKAVPPTYEGRYQVVINGKSDGIDTIIWTVATEDVTDRQYRPVGPWLVEFMRIWDTENVHRMEAMKQMIDEQMAVQEALNIAAAEKRLERSERFATDVLGLKPIRSFIPTQIG